MPSDFSQQAMTILRDGSNFQWYVIPLLAFVFYVYAIEMEKKNYVAVLAGLAFWGMDWFNEIMNSVIFKLAGWAPLWCAPGDTAYLILIGLNIEIMFMFAVSGIIWTKFLLPNKEDKILGVPNRWFIAIAGSIFCVFIEILLNAVDALTWDWAYWDANTPWLIFLFGYLTFFVVAFWVYDMPTMKQKLITVGTIWGVDVLAVLIFGFGLGWL
ncbi:MAG: hypothetical protein HN995_10450 [Candidatus Marinimicrobia bacterium]|jgi:hypothetical protein|nr:hypothetical protein [Candidatus Neomarinimicrobiota bacterium]MBT3577117.1 hypothetical protein [Candidatus Neomarinimicrobiota bacterium]MBT3679999.1 hypothetical protein [Candidatus Neomarinimicrobiota bacterium]MBT3949606.1 hypothetical protein [Candidatus Neomarinimicrobiota bacterium]MBT4253243.1 hypothetical protein [Candidatus Neomarinimicrobiota bacterium]